MSGHQAYPVCEAYEPPQSLWQLVEENVAPGERDEIKQILGLQLVEESLDLQTEVSTLLDIWRDYRTDIEAELPVAPVLPEPPMIRESLCNHIGLLLESLRDKAKEEGRDSGISLSRHNSYVLDYAMQDADSRGCSPVVGSRSPGTSLSTRDGMETPMRMTPCSDTETLSATSSASDRVESVKDHLNILKIDEVVLELRTTLQDEVHQLKCDIAFLHSCLEEESEFRSESSMSRIQPEPSLQDLRTERSKLQKELENTSKTASSISIINSVKPRLHTLPKKLPNAGSLSSSRIKSSKLSPSPPSSASVSRTSLVKASRGVNHTKGNPRASQVISGKDAAEAVKLHKPSSTTISLSSQRNSPLITSNRTPDHKRTEDRSSLGMLRPSPPPSAKPPSGKPGLSSRMRIRMRVPKHEETT